METQIKQLGKVAITIEKEYWNINKAYNKLVIVQEADTFKTYISRKPVPANTYLSNREYWIPFNNLDESFIVDYNKFKKQILRAIDNLNLGKDAEIYIVYDCPIINYDGSNPADFNVQQSRFIMELYPNKLYQLDVAAMLNNARMYAQEERIPLEIKLVFKDDSISPILGINKAQYNIAFDYPSTYDPEYSTSIILIPSENVFLGEDFSIDPGYHYTMSANYELGNYYLDCKRYPID